MKRRFFVFCLLVLTMPCAFAAPSADDAVAAGKTWLNLIDAGDYAGSWKGAAAFFQQGISQARWEKMVKSIRENLGPLQSREYDAAELTKTLPGVPDGDYAIVRFRSIFEHKAQGSETVTLILEKGHWKAAGYFIK
jgi:hypothetical protein